MATTLNAQSAASPAFGSYAQPAAGVTLSGVAQYRDTGVTVQAGAVTTAGPTAATVIVTITPGVAGLWEISGTVSVTGTSVIAAESNNIGLYQTAAAKIAAIPMPCTTAGSGAAVPIPTTVLNLSATDTVNMKVIANATATAIYAGSLVARQIG